MPNYGSLHSPSLRKMENSRQYGRRGVDTGNIIGDPFALATISISAVSLLSLSTSCVQSVADQKWQLAWVISFISSIIAQIQTRDSFPTYTWWTVVYYFFVIGGVFIVVASDTTQTYHVAVVGYLACGLVLTTSSVNSLVYSANGAKEAASAGFILLSMVTVSKGIGPVHPLSQDFGGPIR